MAIPGLSRWFQDFPGLFLEVHLYLEFLSLSLKSSRRRNETVAVVIKVFQDISGSFLQPFSFKKQLREKWVWKLNFWNMKRKTEENLLVNKSQSEPLRAEKTTEPNCKITNEHKHKNTKFPAFNKTWLSLKERLCYVVRLSSPVSPLQLPLLRLRGVAYRHCNVTFWPDGLDNGETLTDRHLVEPVRLLQER